jgi:hypothetical protein
MPPKKRTKIAKEYSKRMLGIRFELMISSEHLPAPKSMRISGSRSKLVIDNIPVSVREGTDKVSQV